MAKSKIRTAGIRRYNAAVKQIMEDRGVERWEAQRIYRKSQNGAEQSKQEITLEGIAEKSVVTIDNLEGIVKSRLETLEAQMESLQAKLDDAKTEIAKWQRVAVAIAGYPEQHREGV